ncbi:VOC family protein [Filobacillus milosensis]|uniref:VOC family protein n=1 Tax=Filobacillus milosensis TaxID=94137 RepID=A0A4Y8IQ58_9BACI|nr:VOC family protein [Filobacillus milosensis]TFB22833.1 VOC family protein [Filobacillus milosensis]
MSEKLIRVGTTYVPVSNVERSAAWYEKTLGAQINYKDESKAIIDVADHSMFLVKAAPGQTNTFQVENGNDHFNITFEVDGYEKLHRLHNEFSQNDVMVGPIEDRGHPGNNFTFQDPDGNLFDVWSELSPTFQNK